MSRRNQLSVENSKLRDEIRALKQALNEINKEKPKQEAMEEGAKPRAELSPIESRLKREELRRHINEKLDKGIFLPVKIPGRALKSFPANEALSDRAGYKSKDNFIQKLKEEMKDIHHFTDRKHSETSLTHKGNGCQTKPDFQTQKDEIYRRDIHSKPFANEQIQEQYPKVNFSSEREELLEKEDYLSPIGNEYAQKHPSSHDCNDQRRTIDEDRREYYLERDRSGHGLEESFSEEGRNKGYRFDGDKRENRFDEDRRRENTLNEDRMRENTFEKDRMRENTFEKDRMRENTFEEDRKQREYRFEEEIKKREREFESRNTTVRFKSTSPTGENAYLKESFRSYYESDKAQEIMNTSKRAEESSMMSQIEKLRSENMMLKLKLEKMNGKPDKRKSVTPKARRREIAIKPSQSTKSLVAGNIARGRHCTNCDILLSKGYSTTGCHKHGRSKSTIKRI